MELDFHACAIQFENVFISALASPQFNTSWKWKLQETELF